MALNLANLNDFSVGNTLVSAQSVAPILSLNIDELLTQTANNPSEPINMNDSSNNYPLTINQLIHALVGQQLINTTNWTGFEVSKNLTFGADTLANSSALVELFNLSSSSPYRTLTFQFVRDTNGTYPPLGSLMIANTSGTSNYIRFLAYNDPTPSDSRELVAETALRNGSKKTIRVRYATVTEGQNIVEFSVLSDSLTTFF